MAWTDIPDVDVEAGGIPKGSTITAIRDNFAGMANGDAGAPVIVGAIYDYQEFTASGTWTKPSDAVAGDWVYVQLIGGGGAGGRNNSLNNSTYYLASGGAGGSGYIHKYKDIAALDATEAVVVGAGATGRSSSGTGATGGVSSFRSSSVDGYLAAQGGNGGVTSSGGVSNISYPSGSETTLRFNGSNYGYGSGLTSGATSSSPVSEYGAGNGGGASRRRDPSATATLIVGIGQHGGVGGAGAVQATASNGVFPGGGGGASVDGTSGNGASGVVRVWCIRPQGI